MLGSERRVLHVLPHAGGGGDTYVDVLGEMPGYTFQRVYVAPRRKPGIRDVAGRARELRRVVSGYDLLHVHGEGAAAMLLPLVAARRSVVTLHGLHVLRRVTGVRRKAAELNARAIVRTASRTICVSNAERELLASVVGDSAARRAVVVHNGARPSATGSNDSTPVGIWVGSLDERRDPLAVVRAAEATATQLLIVGEGPLRGQVEDAAGSTVRVLGQRSDVPDLLDSAGFFVLMSQREGLSFALLEAMAHGLPAIVADIPENVEAVGDTGIAVPYGDEEAVAAAFRRLVESPQERAELGERARRRVAELFSVEDMVARTRAVYDDVLAFE
jgi:glycosyltransferase involved in cell wall biosynthesis